MVARQTGNKWSPPSKSEVEAYHLQATALLAEAWDNPTRLGLDSDIALRCKSLLDTFSAFDIPEEPDLRDLHSNVLWICWCATWRARDYSIMGWRKRAMAADPAKHLVQALQTLEHHGRVHEGVLWPSMHVPLFDRSGKLVDLSGVSGQAFGGYGYDEFFNEGWMLPPEASTAQLYGAQTPTRWAYFATGSKFSNSKIENCWVDNGEYQTGMSAQYTFFSAPVNSRDLLDGTVHWKENLFLRDCNIKVHDASVEDRLNGAKFGGRLMLSVASTAPLALRLDALKGVRSLFIETEEGPDLSVTIANCDLRLTVQHLRSSSHPQSLLIDHSNILLTLENSAEGSVRVTDCSLLAHFVGGSLREIEMSDSDVEFPLGLAIPVAALRFENFFVQRLLVTGCVVDAEVAQTNANFGQIEIEGSKFRHMMSLRNSAITQSIEIKPKGDVKSVFEKALDLSCSSPKSDGKDIPYAAFSQCQFNGSVNLQNREFSGTTRFPDCKFSGHLLVHGTLLHQDTSFVGAEFDWKAVLASTETDRDRRTLLTSLSHSYRSLRQAMEANNASHDAQAFHVLQMRTRNHWKYGPAKMSERLVGNIYDVLSEYGSSFLRPLLGLVFVFLASFAIYSRLVPICGNVSEIFSAALTSTFRPFATFTAAYGSWNASTFHFDSGHEVLAFLVQKHGATFAFVSFLQSVCVVLLIFLMLLAIRRKFQLN